MWLWLLWETMQIENVSVTAEMYQTVLLRSGVLKLGTVDTWGWIILCVGLSWAL